MAFHHSGRSCLASSSGVGDGEGVSPGAAESFWQSSCKGLMEIPANGLSCTGNGLQQLWTPVFDLHSSMAYLSTSPSLATCPPPPAWPQIWAPNLATCRGVYIHIHIHLHIHTHIHYPYTYTCTYTYTHMTCGAHGAPRTHVRSQWGHKSTHVGLCRGALPCLTCRMQLYRKERGPHPDREKDLLNYASCCLENKK